MASVVNLEVLKTCRAGIYPHERLAALSRKLLLRYFEPAHGTQDSWQVKPALRQRVTLKRLNLMDEFCFEEYFEFIFCRNVLIYFDAETQAKVVAHLVANLARKGYLFVGHAEPLLHTQTVLQAIGDSVYRKTGNDAQ